MITPETYLCIWEIHHLDGYSHALGLPLSLPHLSRASFPYTLNKLQISKFYEWRGNKERKEG